MFLNLRILRETLLVRRVNPLYLLGVMIACMKRSGWCKFTSRCVLSYRTIGQSVDYGSFCLQCALLASRLIAEHMLVRVSNLRKLS